MDVGDPQIVEHATAEGKHVANALSAAAMYIDALATALLAPHTRSPLTSDVDTLLSAAQSERLKTVVRRVKSSHNLGEPKTAR